MASHKSVNWRLPVLGIDKLASIMPHQSHADLVKKRNAAIVSRFDAVYRTSKTAHESQVNCLTLSQINECHEKALQESINTLAEEFYLMPRTILQILKTA